MHAANAVSHRIAGETASGWSFAMDVEIDGEGYTTAHLHAIAPQGDGYWSCRDIRNSEALIACVSEVIESARAATDLDLSGSHELTESEAAQVMEMFAAASPFQVSR